jgi:hypothetical protein
MVIKYLTITNIVNNRVFLEGRGVDILYCNVLIWRGKVNTTDFVKDSFIAKCIFWLWRFRALNVIEKIFIFLYFDLLIKKELFYFSLYLIIVSQNYQFWYKQTNFYTPVLRQAVLCDWVLRAGGRLHNNFSSVYRIFTKLGHMIPLWKGKNLIYFGVIRSKVKVTITINRIFDNRVVSTW